MEVFLASSRVQTFARSSPAHHARRLNESISVLQHFHELESLSIALYLVDGPSGQPPPRDLAWPGEAQTFLPIPDQLANVSLQKLSRFKLDTEVHGSSLSEEMVVRPFQSTSPWPTLAWIRSSCSLHTLSLSSSSFRPNFDPPCYAWPGLKKFQFIAESENEEECVIEIGNFVHGLGHLDTMGVHASVFKPFPLEQIFRLTFGNRPLATLATLVLTSIEPSTVPHQPFGLLFPSVTNFTLSMTDPDPVDDLASFIDHLFPTSCPCPALQRFDWGIDAIYSESIGTEEGALSFLGRFQQTQSFPALKTCIFRCDNETVDMLPQKYFVKDNTTPAEIWQMFNVDVQRVFTQLVAQSPDRLQMRLYFDHYEQEDENPLSGMSAVGAGEVERIMRDKQPDHWWGVGSV